MHYLLTMYKVENLKLQRERNVNPKSGKNPTCQQGHTTIPRVLHTTAKRTKKKIKTSTFKTMQV